MPEQRHETRARKAKLAISYITAGTLLVVWSIIWLLYLTLPLDVSGTVYLATGVVLSGISVVVIGMKVGDIGREANVDEDEPDDGNQQVKVPPAPKSVATTKTDPSIAATDSEDVELETRRTANM